VADSEEAILSQAESVKSTCSDIEFRNKTLHFFDNMARLRQDEEREQKELVKVASASFTLSRKNIAGSADIPLYAPGNGSYATEVEPYLISNSQVMKKASSKPRSECKVELSVKPAVRTHTRQIAVVPKRSALAPRLSLSRLDEETVCMADVTWKNRKQSSPPTQHLDKAVQIQQDRLRDTFNEFEIARQHDLARQKSVSIEQEASWQAELDKIAEMTKKKEIVKQEDYFANELGTALSKELSRREEIVKRQEHSRQQVNVSQQVVVGQDVPKKPDGRKSQEMVWQKKIDKLLITVKQRDADEGTQPAQQNAITQRVISKHDEQREHAVSEVKSVEQVTSTERQFAAQKKVDYIQQEAFEKQREVAWQEELTKLLEKTLQQKSSQTTAAPAPWQKKELNGIAQKESHQETINQQITTDETNLIAISISSPEPPLQLKSIREDLAGKITVSDKQITLHAAEMDVAAALLVMFDFIREISKMTTEYFISSTSICGHEICTSVVFMEKVGSCLVPYEESSRHSVPNNFQIVMENVFYPSTCDTSNTAQLPISDVISDMFAWNEVSFRAANRTFSVDDKLVKPASEPRRLLTADDSSEDDVYYDASDVPISELTRVTPARVAAEQQAQTIDDLICELTAIATETEKIETPEQCIEPATDIKLQVSVENERIQTAPMFELPLADVTAFDGGGAILECRVIGTPVPDVAWFINGTPVKISPPEVTLSYHAGVCRLVIVDVLPDDEGQYTVKATNQAGYATTTCYLTVLREYYMILFLA